MEYRRRWRLRRACQSAMTSAAPPSPIRLWRFCVKKQQDEVLPLDSQGVPIACNSLINDPTRRDRARRTPRRPCWT